MAVHTVSVLFPPYSSDFIHLSLNFISYKFPKSFRQSQCNRFSVLEILWEKAEKITIHFKQNQMD